MPDPGINVSSPPGETRLTSGDALILKVIASSPVAANLLVRYSSALLAIVSPAIIVLLMAIILGTWLAPVAGGQTNPTPNTSNASAVPVNAFLDSLSDTERAWLREHPIIRVAQDPSWPPIEFADETGTSSGMTSDYLKILEQRLGVKFERVQNLSWRDAYAKMQAWEIDMTTTVALTKERESFWAFTRPYMTIPIVIVTQHDVTYIGDLRELSGRKVAVVDGYVSSVWLKQEFPTIQLVPVETTKECLEMAQRGEVFACVENMLVVNHYMAQLQMTDLKIAGGTPYTNAQRMAVRKDWAPLAGILDKALDSISEAERRSIYKRWLPILRESKFDHTSVWPVVAVLAVILAGLIAWNWKLGGDIRHRKRAEQAIESERERLNEAQRIGNIGDWEFDLATGSISWSPQTFRILGRDPTLGPPKSYEENSAMFEPESAALMAEKVAAAIASGEPQEYELVALRPDRQRVDLQARAVPRKDETGKVVTLYGTIQDITERVRAERLIRESEERLSFAMEASQVGDWDMDLRTNVARRSLRHDQCFGYVEMLPEWGYDTFLAHVGEADRDRVNAGFQKAMAGEGEYNEEFRAQWPDGSVHWLWTRGRFYFDEAGQPYRVAGTVVEISELKQAEAVLKASEAVMRDLANRQIAILNALPAHIALVDREGVILSVNEAWRRFATANVLQSEDFSIGQNYLGVCEQATGDCSTEAQDVAVGIREVLAGSNPEFAIEYPCHSPEEKRWFRLMVTPLHPDRQQGAVVMHINITERKLAEEAVRESEERYRLLFEKNPIPMWVYDLKSLAFLEVNNAAVYHYGYSHDEFLSMTILDIRPSDDIPAVLRSVADNGSDHHDQQVWRHVKKDGTVIDVEITSHALSFLDHSARLVLAKDITETTRAKIALSESEERYRDLVENATDIIYTHDLQGNYTSVNKAGEAISGYTEEESLKINLADTLAPEYLEKAMQMTAAKLAGKDVTAYELELIAKDGRRVPIEVNTRIVKEKGVPVGVQGIARDITERKLADAQITESRQRLRLATESMGLGVWDWDIPSDTLVWDQRMYELYGIRKEDFGGAYDAWVSGLHPDDREKAEAEFQAAVDEDIPYHSTFRVVRPDGEIRFLEARAVVMRSSDGSPLRMIGVNADVTERILADRDLRESNERFEQLADTITDVFWVRSPDMKELYYISPAYEKVWGRSLESNYKKPGDWTEFIVPEDRDLVASTFQTLMRDAPTVDLDYRITRPDGEIRWVHLRGFQDRNESGQLMRLIGIVEDITERKQLEEQFRQSQKMEAVGVLAGGIAHDFNNLLTAINGYSDLTLRRLGADDALRHNVEEIKKAGFRATELTSQLLAFSRKQVLKPIVHNLNTSISNIENMLRRVIKEDIELRTILASDLGNIRVDPGQIEQVIMNLSVNARDAMPNGGTLTIETENIYLGHEYVGRHIGVAEGDYVKMTVTDTGAGMDEITLKHIFEPFFTTKSVGSGTGLGLSTVHGIVSQSGGDIQVYSEVGHGTSFKIYLPFVDELVLKPRLRDDAGEDLTGTETILLVEDEELVRNLTHEILMSNGYNVLVADNGKTALSIIASYSERIDLVLTDVIMPGISGPVMAEQIRESRPDVKVLFMSGYTDNAILNKGTLESGSAFIEKPFTPDSLGRKIRGILKT